jgi:hypothetical protein
MKEKIGIALLILLNAGFIYLMIVLFNLSFGLFSGHSGLKAVERANDIAGGIFNKASFLTAIAFVSNHIVLRTLIQSKKPILYSIIITLIGLLISIPFYFTERRSFIQEQYGKVVLSDYIDCKEISKVQLFILKDTIPIESCEDFFQVIGTASYNNGIWKYQKSNIIVLWKTNGTKDTILSSGGLFELSDGKFFKADENLIEKYIRLWHVRMKNVQ